MTREQLYKPTRKHEKLTFSLTLFGDKTAAESTDDKMTKEQLNERNS